MRQRSAAYLRRISRTNLFNPKLSLDSSVSARNNRAANMVTKYAVTANPPRLAKICHRGTAPIVMRVIIEDGAVNGNKLRNTVTGPLGDWVKV